MENVLILPVKIKEERRKMKIVGIMSGTSMDGVDLALCELTEVNGNFQYQIIASQTFAYEEKWRVRLSQLRYQNAENYARTDIFYGKYLGELVNSFLQSNGLQADLIASHGHTIFHDPAGWLTAQIGDGPTINATTGIPVVSNFRRADVALGGQGAPLAGLGDQLLFSEYPVCINLGGFCNISGKGTNWDISPCNIVFNRLAREVGKKFDENGQIAEAGEIIFPLLNQLNNIPYYQKNGPKSLGREWINKNFWHLVRDYDNEPLENKMKTLIAHVSFQIARSIDQLVGNNGAGEKVLVTGGGAHNPVLVEFLKSESDADIIVPEPQLIDFKESLIFALLGYLRVKNRNNTDAAFTGAGSNFICGSLDGDFSGFMN